MTWGQSWALGLRLDHSPAAAGLLVTCNAESHKAHQKVSYELIVAIEAFATIASETERVTQR